MKIKHLIELLKEFDEETEVKLSPRNSIVTERIVDVRLSEHPCPNICVLIEGVL